MKVDTRLDFWSVLDQAPAEVAELRAVLVDGQIDGRTYRGHCACLIGTIANARGCDPDEFERNPYRPAEEWFYPIDPGDTPDGKSVGARRAATAVRWIDEWLQSKGESS